MLTSATLAVAGGFDYVRRAAWAWSNARTPDGARPFRLPEAGAALRAAAPARAAQPGLLQGRRRGSDRASSATAAGAPSCSSPATSRCGWCTTTCRSKSNIPRCCKAPGRARALLEEFRSTPNCVLFATSSFWQGVDVPGEQLSCVIIDKLPFAVPNDPVVNARIESIRGGGGQSVLRLPDSAGRHRAETGIRPADPRQVGPRRAGPAGQPHHQTALRPGVFRQPARLTDSPPRWKTWRSFSMFEVTIEETFAAGHALRNYHGKCENVHGHNYRCHVTRRGRRTG